MIKPYKFWHSPVNVYWHLDKLSKEVDPVAIEKNREYQLAREARIGAMLALAMFQKLGKPTYLQLYRPDPPDLLLMQQSKTGQRDITQIEVTSYVGSPKETLLEQLIRKKIKPGINLYSENYIFLVNVGIGLNVNYRELRDYLNSNKIPFPVWTLQEKSLHPDTVAKLIIVNPKIYETEINIGEAEDTFSKLKLPGVICSGQRVVNRKFLIAKPSGRNTLAPWETVGIENST